MTAYLRADPQRRTDVRFPSAGTELAGHLYRPPGTPGITTLLSRLPSDPSES